MHKKFLLATVLFFSLKIFAQSPKTILVEHFTNTKCSICANRNPGFYSTLANYPQVIHIAFHPSSPYSQCFFSLQNPIENDARTNFYGAYGSTPKFVLNGKLLPSSNPAITNTTIDTALNQTSPVEISATEELIGTDSVKSRVVVRTTGSIAATEFLLFAGVAQDTVQYTGSNGESLHHDVFRKALTKVTGDTIQIPAINDSLVFNFAYKIQNGWREPNLATIAFVQLANTKQVLNAAKSHRVVTVVSSVNEINENEFSVYPNPTNSELVISNYQLLIAQPVMIFDLEGRKIMEQKILQNRIDVSELANGIYFLKIGNTVKKIVKNP